MHVTRPSATSGLRIALANWRDLTHPDGGGSERYVEQVAHGLAARGHDVTVLCADHGRAPRDQVVEGVAYRRRGGRLGVYAAAAAGRIALERRGRFDVVVDVQNGLPFLTPLSRRAPVVNLVHHVHREQWPVVFPRPVAAAGWLIESRLAPLAYRGRQYVAVSEQTRSELIGLGVRAADVAVIHNGTDVPLGTAGRSPDPVLVVLGRLVPHKRVEHAVEVLATLRDRHPTLRLRVIGEGWWRGEIVAAARRLGVCDRVDLLGFVDERTKHDELARAWVKLAPSVKEGWGLCVVEAGSHGVPTVAYADAGGLSESIVDGRTGVLATGLADMVAQTDRLLRDRSAREQMGQAARTWSQQFSWAQTVSAWDRLLRHTAAGGAPRERHDQDLTRLGSRLG